MDIRQAGKHVGRSTYQQPHVSHVGTTTRMVAFPSLEAQGDYFVHFCQLRCTCWVNATVASSSVTWPEAELLVEARAMRLLMFLRSPRLAFALPTCASFRPGGGAWES